MDVPPAILKWGRNAWDAVRIAWPLLAALLLSIAPAAGQPAPGEPQEVLTDGPDDVATADGVPASGLPASDLRALHATADADRLRIAVQVAGLGDRPLADAATYYVDWDYGGVHYTVRMQRLSPVDGGPVVRGELYQADAETGLARLLEELEVTQDGPAATVTAAVPIGRLRTATGVPASDGAVLEDLRVRSERGEVQILVDLVEGGSAVAGAPMAAPRTFYDFMPDDGGGLYRLSLPVAAGGEVYLTSPDPFRASNGGPGTYVFPIRLVNQDDAPQDRRLAVTGLPAGWSHAFVSDALHLEPADDVTTQLVVEAAGGHEHGGATNFTVQAARLDGSPAGAVHLAVVYTEVPQPAGHHPTLNFHVVPQGPTGGDTPFAAVYGGLDTAFGAFGLHDNGVIMNTLDEDPSALAQPASPDNHTWEIALSPGLAMGLDFDVARNGLVHATLQAPMDQQPATGVVLEGVLLLRTADGDVELATAPPSAPVDVAGPTDIDLTLVPTAAADLVPYAPKQGLVLLLRETHTSTDAERIIGNAPNLLAGRMTLPLLEYQDPVPAGTDRDIIATVSPERQDGNPGDTVGFRIEVRNAGTLPLDLDLTVLSTAVEARLLRPSLRVGVGETLAVDLHVSVPADAADGDQVTAFVRLADGQVATLVGATVTVTTRAEVPSVGEPPAQGAPGVAAPLLLAALAVLALTRRS